MKHVIGVWCGAGPKPMAEVHHVPTLRLVIKRLGPCWLLIPWMPDLDWLEPQAHGWAPIRRCHPDERIAMRDLIVETGADVGAIVAGDCASIDLAEVRLAIARVNAGWEKYESPRVRAHPSKTWLGFGDSEEWAGPEMVKHIPANDLEIRMDRLKSRLK